MFELEVDEQITLKSFETTDAKELYALMNRSRLSLQEWIGWVDDINSENDYEPLIKNWQREFASDNGFHVGIFYRGQITGTIGYTYLNLKHRSTEIAYWLGEEFRGKGIMARACARLVKHTFEDIGLHRIECRIAEKNSKSQAIPSKLGFSNEGCLHDVEWLNGHFVNHIIYGMLEEDWKNRVSPS